MPLDHPSLAFMALSLEVFCSKYIVRDKQILTGHFKCHYVKCGSLEENQGKSDISEWADDISEQITRY